MVTALDVAYIFARLAVAVVRMIQAGKPRTEILARVRRFDADIASIDADVDRILRGE
jgi:hypothetical protein